MLAEFQKRNRAKALIIRLDGTSRRGPEEDLFWKALGGKPDKVDKR